MLAFDQSANDFIREISGLITAGNTINLQEAPGEVRIFDQYNQNGNLISWTFSDGVCELERALTVGEIAKAYKTSGSPAFLSELFVNNLTAELNKAIEVSFIDTNIIKDFELDVYNPFSSQITFQWKTAGGSLQDFPITADVLSKDTYHEFFISCTISEDIPKTNYRDIHFDLTYRRVGDE
jgi:hypothetical protein